MVRTKDNGKGISTLERVISGLLARTDLARRMGWSYGGDRKLYEALGYPTEKELDFKYYYNKYDRQDIAAAVIDRPADATWNGELVIVEEDTMPADSQLFKAWQELNKTHNAKQRLCRLDKLAGIGQFALLLFGFVDVKKADDFKNPVGTGTLKLNYLKQLSQAEVTINEWEKNSSNKRYGLPKSYKIVVGTVGNEGQFKDIVVHHSRVLHVMEGSLSSEVYGRPRLKPIINRLVDLEKVLGGDAEMFWRNARPGFHAKPDEGFSIGEKEEAELEAQLDKYEHDLRRFITASGVDIKALEQQVADPLNHIDIQLQAIAAQTGIPKRVLIGSERGELASSQDRDAWLTLVKTRMEEFAEPDILRPFIDKCMLHGILPKVEQYNVMWEDVFAPSEKDKVEVGKKRSEALKVYAESPFASEFMPPELAYKYLLGLNEDQVQEVLQAAEEAAIEEERRLAEEGPEEVVEIVEEVEE